MLSPCLQANIQLRTFGLVQDTHGSSDMLSGIQAQEKVHVSH